MLSDAHSGPSNPPGPSDASGPLPNAAATRALRSERDSASRAEFLRAVERVEQLLADNADADAGEVARQRRRLAALPPKLATSESRIAFVGTVKSGKSTLINALLGQDVLPRGAGILTSQVTELHPSDPPPRLSLQWRSAAEVDVDFSRLLTALGRPGSWSLAEAPHRQLAAELLAGTAPSQAGEELAALLRGYPRAQPHLGQREEQPSLPSDGLRSWVTRDEVAAFLRELHLYTPAPQLTGGFCLIDCQGYDAWNPAHAADLLAALQRTHALVYVVSSRVGLRDADFRLLEQIRGLGLLDLTRFVLNVDWGEIRRPEDLDRVREDTRRRLRELHAEAQLHPLSALQGLLEHQSLTTPEALSAGEQRLLEAWDGDCAGGMSASREHFRAFREQLWHDAREERERVVLQRLRAELRGILVDVAGVLRRTRSGAAEVSRIAWEDDASERMLHWLQQGLDQVAAACRDTVRSAIAGEFRQRGSAQRKAWRRALHDSQRDPDGSAPPAAVLAQLTATEPTRINAVRNQALVARGELARRGEELGVTVAQQLAAAGVACTPPPGRALLAREITVTRQIPLFSHWAGPALHQGTAGAGWRQRLLASFGARASRPAAGKVHAAALAAVRRRQLQRAWNAYLDQVLEQCLLPHVDEAAARVYACLAAWFTAQLRPETAAIGAALDHPDRD